MKLRKMKLAACLLSVATAVSAVPTYAVEDLFVSGPDEVAVEEAYYPEETGDVLTEAVGMDEGDLFSDSEIFVQEEAPVVDEYIPEEVPVGDVFVPEEVVAEDIFSESVVPEETVVVDAPFDAAVGETSTDVNVKVVDRNTFIWHFNEKEDGVVDPKPDGTFEYDVKYFPVLEDGSIDKEAEPSKVDHKEAMAEVAETIPASCVKPAMVILKVVINEDGAVEGNGTFFSGSIDGETGKIEGKLFTAKDSSTDTGLSKPLGHSWEKFEEITAASRCDSEEKGEKHVVIRCNRENCDDQEEAEGLGGKGHIYKKGGEEGENGYAKVKAYDDELTLHGKDIADWTEELAVPLHKFDGRTREVIIGDPYYTNKDEDGNVTDDFSNFGGVDEDGNIVPAEDFKPVYYAKAKETQCSVCKNAWSDPEVIETGMIPVTGEILKIHDVKDLLNGIDEELNKNTKAPADEDFEFFLADCKKPGKYEVGHYKHYGEDQDDVLIQIPVEVNTPDGTKFVWGDYVDEEWKPVEAGHHVTITTFATDKKDPEGTQITEENKIFKLTKKNNSVTYENATGDDSYYGIDGSLLCIPKQYYEIVWCTAPGHGTTIFDEKNILSITEKTAPAIGSHVLTQKAQDIYDELSEIVKAGSTVDYEKDIVNKYKGNSEVSIGKTTATCEEEGVTEIGFKCAVCGEYVEPLSVKTKALGHKKGDPQTVEGSEIAPTCLAEGSREVVVYCTRCGKELGRATETLEKVPHEWSKTPEFEFVGDVVVDNWNGHLLETWNKTHNAGPYNAMFDTMLWDSKETGIVIAPFQRCTKCGITKLELLNNNNDYDIDGDGELDVFFYGDEDSVTTQDEAIQPIPGKTYDVAFKYSDVTKYEGSCNPGEGSIKLTAEITTTEKGKKVTVATLERTFNYYTSLSNYQQGNKHNWGQPTEVIVTPATETQPGVKQIIVECTNCHKQTIRNEAIPATGHIHNLTAVEAKAATCVEDGNIAYWFCAGDNSCGKFFTDAEGKTEIEEASIKIPATGKHDLEAVEAKAATCTEAGNTAYFKCKVCGKIFSDAEATVEIEEAATVVAALGHDLQKVEAKEATTEAEGNKEYWVCSRCGEYFADEAGTQPIEDKTSVIIPKLEPVITPTVTPTPIPEEPTVTPTPIPEEPTVTPTPIPEEPTVTPTPTPEPIAKPATAPKISTVAKATSIKVTVTGEVDGADKYMVRYRTPEGTYTYETFTGTTYTITGLARGERYLVSVRGGNDGGWGPYSTNSKRFTQLTSRSYKAAKNQITVKFTCAKATRFEVRYSLNKNMKNYTTVSAEGNGGAVAVIKGLKSGTTYYLRVRPFFGNYIGRFGQVFAVTTK